MSADVLPFPERHHVCAHCGGAIPRNRLKRPERYCSPDCKLADRKQDGE